MSATAALRRAALILGLILSGCASQPLQPIANMFRSKAEQSLAAGVDQFEEGRYAESTRSLQDAINQGLSADSDKVKAYKYLAFDHCVSNRRTQCMDAFRAALKIQPSMDLEPSEAGHPLWGP